MLDGAGERPADPRAVTAPAASATRQPVDPYEPDDDPGFEVIVDLAVSNELDRVLTRGDRDRFAFLVRDAATVTVETITEVDLQLLFYREREHIPFFASGANFDGSGARVELSLDAGWYVAEVVGFSDQTTGDYRLRIGHGGAVVAPSGGARLPLPTTIAVDHAQTRYTTGGEDWVELQVPAPGFYLLAARSFGAPLGLALYHDPAAAPVVAARPGLTASAVDARPEAVPGGMKNAVALFAGRRVVHARIHTGALQEIAYYLSLTPFSAPRRFADAAPFAVALDGGVGFHTLRIFSAGTYAAAVRDGLGVPAMRVFAVPDMDPMPARPYSGITGTTEYQLAAGDYLVELSAPEPHARIRVCWTTADATPRCDG